MLAVAGVAQKTEIPGPGGIQRRDAGDGHLPVATDQFATECIEDLTQQYAHGMQPWTLAYLPPPFSALITLSVMSYLGLM